MARCLIAVLLASLAYSANAASSIHQRVHSIGGPLTCAKQKDSAICDDMDECTWCVGTTVGTGCYPMSAAKLLPSKYFTCDKPPSSVQATGKPKGTGRTKIRGSNDSCDKRSEDSCVAPDCVWCTSAAVGGGCYTPDEAKLLPAAIFKCKTAPAFFKI